MARTPFKLRSGNNPSAMKMYGVSPLKKDGKTKDLGGGNSTEETSESFTRRILDKPDFPEQRPVEDLQENMTEEEKRKKKEDIETGKRIKAELKSEAAEIKKKLVESKKNNTTTNNDLVNPTTPNRTFAAKKPTIKEKEELLKKYKQRTKVKK